MTDVRENIPHILEEHRKWRHGGGGCRADLAGADLAGVNMAGADLYGADLSGADLSGAYLSGADLAGANMAGADLSGADLYGADLARADLSGADLYGADLARAYLSGAYLIDGGQRVDGYRFVGWIKDGVLMIRAGCRDMTLGEYREHNAKREDDALRVETDAILSHIKAVAVARGLVSP